ncbi:MAG: UMP kinase [Prevotellaceae bacterium]|jgi:uridylate kinase|nr:UMP kinase [Prevotellaceae bacterium]
MRFRRILLKLSGECLAGSGGTSIDSDVIVAYAKEIHEVCASGVQVAIVVGGGNIFRGLKGVGQGFDRVKGDQMGMLATTINSIALSCTLRSEGLETEVFSATQMEPYARYWVRDQAVECLEKGGVALISGGTGNPFFTTDSAAALRAVELGASALFKGTRVDGVYNADPEKEPTAIKYNRLSFDEALQKNLKVMDITAFALCKENKMPVVVFDMNKRGNLLRLVKGDPIGTELF